jgi:hypothetical protein
MEIKDLQHEVNGRWDAQENPCAKSDPNHALLHMTKALGKVASALNDAQHERRDLLPGEVDKYLADLVICAARFGAGIVDLGAACEARLAEKFPLEKLPKIVQIRLAMKGDPLGVGRDPELQITAVAASYERYMREMMRRDRFSDLVHRAARSDWLASLDAFATWERFSPFIRYYLITEWLLKTRFRHGSELDQDDEADVAERLDDLWKQLYEPERAAIESVIEALKRKYTPPNERQASTT